MSIDGSFGINVVFHDREGSRIKVVQLADHINYTTGKVAIVTGTVGTEFNAVVNFTSYRNASGQTASMTVRRAAFQCEKDAYLSDATGYGAIRSNGNRVSIGDMQGGEVVPLFTSGTAAWTVVLWGE